MEKCPKRLIISQYNSLCTNPLEYGSLDPLFTLRAGERTFWKQWLLQLGHWEAFEVVSTGTAESRWTPELWIGL